MTKENKQYEYDLAHINKNKEDETYALKLDLEERSRKQMESYARELSIRYANASDNETITRLKDTCNGLLEEKKFLTGKLDKAEKEMNNLKKMKTVGNSKENVELKSKNFNFNDS